MSCRTAQERQPCPAARRRRGSRAQLDALSHEFDMIKLGIVKPEIVKLDACWAPFKLSTLYHALGIVKPEIFKLDAV